MQAASVLFKINKTSGVAETKRPVDGMILQQDHCQVLEQKIWCIIEFSHIGTPKQASSGVLIFDSSLHCTDVNRR